MKTLTFLLISLLIAAAGFAQSSDAYLSTSYLGYANGKHKIKVTNKQSCKADIQFKFGGSVTAVSPNPKNNTQQNEVAANSSQIFEITMGTRSSIEVNALSICTWAGSNPVWLNPLSNILPVKFTRPFMIEQKGDRTFKITLFVAEEMNVSHYNIKIATDGLNYKTIAIVFSGETVSPGTYVATITL